MIDDNIPLEITSILLRYESCKLILTLILLKNLDKIHGIELIEGWQRLNSFSAFHEFRSHVVQRLRQ